MKGQWDSNMYFISIPHFLVGEINRICTTTMTAMNTGGGTSIFCLVVASATHNERLMGFLCMSNFYPLLYSAMNHFYSY